MPKQLAVGYQYFGDVDLPIDENVVRRIREEFDQAFVPVLKKELYLLDTGQRLIFRNFGFGLEWNPSIPILNRPVYDAEKPSSGYLATLGRVAAMVEWWPYQRDRDGFPGPTKPFGEWVYSYMKDQHEHAKRLEAASDVPDGYIPEGADAVRAMSIKAMAQATAEQMIADKKKSDQVIKEAQEEYLAEGENVVRMLTEMTEEEYQAVMWHMRNSDDVVKARTSIAVPKIIQ